jgi:hypothetical protein
VQVCRGHQHLLLEIAVTTFIHIVELVLSAYTVIVLVSLGFLVLDLVLYTIGRTVRVFTGLFRRG